MESVDATLNRREIHDKWESSYRAGDNEEFYDLAFDFISSTLPNKGRFLDAGCGSCAHSIRLARRGFSVTAVDFSEPVVANATDNVRRQNLTDKIDVRRENLLQLSFADGTFDHVLCWGVLMHIPEQEAALDELCRVLKPSGELILSEVNVFGIEDVVSRGLRKALKKSKTKMHWTDAGLEMWADSAAGPLLARRANFGWLRRQLEKRGFDIRSRFAGQFSEAYARVPGRFGKKLIHQFNRVWFRYIRWPQPAIGNVLIAVKR